MYRSQSFSILLSHSQAGSAIFILYPKDQQIHGWGGHQLGSQIHTQEWRPCRRKEINMQMLFSNCRPNFFLASAGALVVVWLSYVNACNLALKPLPWLPIRSKCPYLWDILIFETSGTFRSTEKCQCFYKCTMEIDGNWVENNPRYLSQNAWTLQYPQNTHGHSKTPPRTLSVTREQPWLLPSTVWERFGLSRDVRENSDVRCQMMSVGCPKCLWLSRATFGNVKDMKWVVWESLGISEGTLVPGCPGVPRGVGGCKGAQGGVRQYVPFNFRQFQEITNEILNIFQYIRRSQMS